MLSTVEGYPGQTGRGLGLGSDLVQVKDVYGHPDYITPGRQGMYHAYERARIIFQTDADDRVQRWLIYHVAE